jgi:hypothetical protein
VSIETLVCDMDKFCPEPISMIDDKGFVYCQNCGVARRGWGFYRMKVRKLRPHELNRLLRGEKVKAF